MTDLTQPDLYWISGSPPAWRVMLALVVKGVPFTSRRLDHGKGENRDAAYLALNPKGQVPTLRHGPVVIRESIAILAYLDRAWPDRPIFGATAAEAAQIWQDVMVFEADLRPAATVIAPTLLRGASAADPARLQDATDQFLAGLDALEPRLAAAPYLSGDAPAAADCWLYPTLGWIDRALASTTDSVSPALATYSNRPALAAWRTRLGALPGVAATHPPHWAD